MITLIISKFHMFVFSVCHIPYAYINVSLRLGKYK